MRMTWDAVGAVAELIGTIAVLATLAYLALQVRHGRQLLEESRTLTLCQVYQNRTDTRMENQRFIAGDGYIAPLLARIASDGVEVVDDLTMEDKIRLRSYGDAQLLGINNVLYQREIEILDERDVIEGVHASLRANMPIWVAVGCRIRHRVDEEFGSLVSD